ncbi:MAG: dihydroorotate dehydrogenase [Nitrospinota bacterium]
MADLTVKIANINFANPILGASGTFGYGNSFEQFYPLDEIGGFVTKGLSILPMSGNPTPRMIETPSGLLNSIGLQNIGFEKFKNQVIPSLKIKKCKMLVNIFATSVDGYALLTKKVTDLELVSGIELNISCPNVRKGGIIFGSDPIESKKVIAACRAATDLPLFVKLSPNVTDIKEFAHIGESEGADGLSLINTVRGMAIDILKESPSLANIKGGLSGPAIKPIALSMIWDAYEAVKIPIIGIGGITNASDVVEFLMAGASAVQIGSHNFVDPTIVHSIIDELDILLERLNYNSVTDIIGLAAR